ncbi:hypothetical protein [Segatella copri]|uniref:hypothetical protein n=1 Tax=Segatella copri TaxID=165179 RepID=UPI001F480EDE|nr:hypothetical protein [Segatella copri]
MKKLSKKQTLSYLALQKVARLQELLKLTQNAEVVTSCDNYTPEAYTQNSKFINDAQKEIYSLLEGIKRDVECI